MSETITLSPAEVSQAVYLGVAGAQKEPGLDILAGVICHTLLEHPGLSTQQIREVIDELHHAIAANRPDPQFDLSPNDSILTIRILGRVIPALSTPALRDGAKLFTRAFLNSHRRGTGRLRQVAPIEMLFDRTGEAEQFLRDTWQRLYELARADPAIADAIDQSQIGVGLGVQTAQAGPAMLAQVELPQLKTFVDEFLQSDGRLVVPSDKLKEALGSAAAAAQQLREQYLELLKKINDAEQKARKGEPGLLDRIKEAVQKKEEIDKFFEKTGQGVDSTFSVLAFSAERFDGEFAADIREFGAISMTLLENVRKFTKAAIGTAEVVQKLASASASALLTGGGVVFAFAMVALMIKMTGLFAKSPEKSIEQVILEELDKIRKQITSLRDELRVRFDRIDKRLDKIYAGILSRLAEIDFELGEISGNVEETQLALYNLHSELQRLHSNVHAFLEAAHRRDFVEAVNGFLNFRELTGQDLSFENFLEGENEFFSWGVDHAKDPLQAGPEVRSFQDDDLVTELITFTPATNINYLRQWPAERAGLPPLALNRLANPLDWVVAAEAYAQLSEESPSHAGQVSAARVAELVGVGEALGESLSRIADKTLFAALADHYRGGFAQLKGAIASSENTFRIAPETGLRGIDLWGGARQTPVTHFFVEDFDEVRRCDNRNFDASTSTVSANIFGLDHSQLLPYMVASNLRGSAIPGVADGLEKLGACVSAFWETTQTEELFNQLVRVRYRLVVTLEIRYGAAAVFVHRFSTDVRHAAVVRKSDLPTFDPATDSQQGKDPYPILVEPGDPLWNKLGAFPATHTLANPALLNATSALVEQKLKRIQRAFYAEVARRFAQAGDPISQAGRRLTGSKLLWQSFIVTGLPLSSEANEVLRSFLFGSEALPAGSDPGGEDALLDDVQDIYTYFATRAEDPPPANIMVEVEALANARLGALAETLAGIVDAVAASGQPEPPELFAPTLLRLSLIHS